MTADPPSPRPEPLGATVGRAVLLAGLGGIVVGSLESLGLLEQARYPRWGALLVLVGAAGTALLGAALAVPTALVTRALAGRPAHRAAPPSVCAGLGTIAALAAFVGLGSLPNPLLLPVALGGALFCLALRELLAWWPLAGRAGLWWGLASLALAACALRIAAGHGRLVSAAAAVAALGIVATVTSPLLVRRIGHLAAGLGSLGLPLVGLLLLTAPDRPANAAAGGASAPDVLHVSIDTLRADHLGCYGYARARTPTIDRLAAEGVLFEQATAQANTTGPSHTTQLTGLLPAEHGAVTNGVPLRHDIRTLPEILRARGYETAGFVSGFTLADEASGLAPRFDWYDDALLSWRWMPQVCEELAVVNRIAFRLAARRGVRVTRADRPAGETVDRALEWLAARGAGPAYLFVHFYDPHAPYEPPPGFAPEGPGEPSWYELPTAERAELVADPTRLGRMTALYDGEIAYADAQLARLLESFDLGNTLVILTSDHGEGLGAHDYFFDHGTFLFDEELHVPLILRLPAGARAAHAGVQVPGQARLLDLVPTVLDLLDIETEHRTSGASLVPLLDGPDGVERPSFATAETGGRFSGFDLDVTRLSLRAQGFKLIWTSSHWLDTQRTPERLEVYDLSADPGEQRDLMGADGAPGPPLPELREQLDAWRAATEEFRRAGALSEDVTEELRRLGYL